nr:chemokine (C-C motif) ligand 27 [Sebastes schlegelii]
MFSVIMELKVVLLIVCLAALAIYSTEAGIPKCCITTKKVVPDSVLLKVQRMSVQQSNGACDIPALILYVNNTRRPICAHPKVKKRLRALQWMKENKKKA